MFSKLRSYSTKIKVSMVIPYCMLLFSSPSYSSALPASIDKVETYRINDFLVRVIKHNMEVNPILEFDKIITPEYQIIDSLKISSIIVNDEELKFNESSGVFVESFSSKDDNVLFSLDYFYLDGGSNYIECVVSFSANLITPPKCTIKNSDGSK